MKKPDNGKSKPKKPRRLMYVLLTGDEVRELKLEALRRNTTLEELVTDAIRRTLLSPAEKKEQGR
jgi:hypothetical protein